MKGIAWYIVIKPERESTCKMAINTPDDWSIKVINAPTIKLKIKEDDTL